MIVVVIMVMTFNIVSVIVPSVVMFVIVVMLMIVVMVMLVRVSVLHLDSRVVKQDTKISVFYTKNTITCRKGVPHEENPVFYGIHPHFPARPKSFLA